MAERRPQGCPSNRLNYAALPPHSAERLCLSANYFYFYEAAPQLGGAASRKLESSDGKAEPYRTVRRRSRRR